MFKLSKSITWRLVLPIPIVMVIGMLIMWLMLPPVIDNNVRNDATRHAEQIAHQFKTIRSYYTKSVVKKAVANGALKPSFNHSNEKNGIPLPATLIHDLSELLNEENTTIALYSQFPFPIRRDRELDTFQQQAWEALSKNPERPFVLQETHDGQEVIRVAVADRMVADACVNCHNSHPNSPKTDWQLGDVRGVLEISSHIGPQLAKGAALSKSILLAVAVGGIILIIIALIAARSVTGPLAKMTAVTKRIAAGDHAVDVPACNRVDEIGEMARAVEIFRDDAIEKSRLEADQVEQASRVEQEKREALSLLANELEDSISSVAKNITDTTGKMQLTATGLLEVAGSSTSQVHEAADASSQAAENVRSVASAAEELSASVAEINRQVNLSRQLANEAAETTSRTTSTVASLEQGAQKVGQVVNLISDIAEQTNLLALNATIEAARAGDAGKGFSVVASEVKSLANEVAKATEEISTQINAMQSITGGTVSAIQEIADVIQRLGGFTTQIGETVKEQNLATDEIARNAQGASTSSQRLAELIRQVQEVVNQTEHAANQVLGASGELSQGSEQLRDRVGHFLVQLR